MATERQNNDDNEADDELADIVAYLDGEMEEPAVELMERRLVSNDPLRRYADSLDQTWHLLDSLDEVAASGEFTQKTLSSLAAIETQPQSSPGLSRQFAQLFRQNGLIPSIIGWASFGFLLASVGLLMGQISARPRRGNNAAETLTQLPVLQHYHEYRVIPDLTFLQELSLSPQDPASTDKTP